MEALNNSVEGIANRTTRGIIFFDSPHQEIWSPAGVKPNHKDYVFDKYNAIENKIVKQLRGLLSGQSKLLSELNRQYQALRDRDSFGFRFNTFSLRPKYPDTLIEEDLADFPTAVRAFSNTFAGHYSITKFLSRSDAVYKVVEHTLLEWMKTTSFSPIPSYHERSSAASGTKTLQFVIAQQNIANI